jgi:hypothetical protein
MADFLAILLSSLVTGTVVGAGTWYWAGRLPVRRRVLVTFVHDDAYALDGVLWSAHGLYLVVVRAALVKADGTRTVIDGQVFIERARVAWVQYTPEV